MAENLPRRPNLNCMSRDIQENVPGDASTVQKRSYIKTPGSVTHEGIEMKDRINVARYFTFSSFLLLLQ